MKVKSCIFDLDGTLFNTLEDIKTAVNETIKKFGFEEISLEYCRKIIGSGTKDLLVNAIKKELSEEEFRAIHSEYMINYRKYLFYKTEPFDGIRELISTLKENNILVSVCTNKPDDCAKKLINKFFAENDFFMICGQVENVPVKPNPYFANLIMEKSGIDKEETVFIGDSFQDVLTGHNAGIEVLSVLWGYQDKERISKSGGNHFVNTVKELENYILNGNF